MPSLSFPCPFFVPDTRLNSNLIVAPNFPPNIAINNKTKYITNSNGHKLCDAGSNPISITVKNGRNQINPTEVENHCWGLKKLNRQDVRHNPRTVNSKFICSIAFRSNGNTGESLIVGDRIKKSCAINNNKPIQVNIKYQAMRLTFFILRAIAIYVLWDICGLAGSSKNTPWRPQ